MAQQHYRTPFKRALLQFITEPDPYLSMLQWVITEMMRIEAEAKVGAAKGKHAKERTTYFSGARARRVDTRMGKVYLLVPKVRKGGYVPFFIVEPMFDESEDPWRVFFRKLKARGMKRTALCISDAHAGIQAAVRKEWLGASWPRCKVHFMRSITS